MTKSSREKSSISDERDSEKRSAGLLFDELKVALIRARALDMIERLNRKHVSDRKAIHMINAHIYQIRRLLDEQITGAQKEILLRISGELHLRKAFTADQGDYRKSLIDAMKCFNEAYEIIPIPATREKSVRIWNIICFHI
ncbi:MAG: hypothetical protein AB2L14_00695 [Candidatus Xenobiia bacterium LiM19]